MFEGLKGYRVTMFKNLEFETWNLELGI